MMPGTGIDCPRKGGGRRIEPEENQKPHKTEGLAPKGLRHSGEMTQVCPPKVTHDKGQKQAADAGYRYPAERVLPMGKWWRRRVS